MTTEPIFRYAPPPYQDEAVSSWFDRIAAGYGTERQSLFGLLGIDEEDIDFTISPGSLARISQATNVPDERISALTISNARPWMAPSDLLEVDVETTSRGLVCRLCLEEDEGAGRHHYVRADWLNLWGVTCQKHHVALQDYSAVILEDQGRALPRSRIKNLADMHALVNVKRRLKPVRMPSIPVPVQVHALEEALRILHAQGEIDGELWSLSSNWEETRSALLDLIDFLFHGAPPNSSASLVSWFDHPEDQALPGFHHSRPGRRVLGRLSAPWRIKVLSAVAHIVFRPDKFQSTALYAFGKGYLLGMAGLRVLTMGRLKGLVQIASDDPLAMLLCVAVDHEAEILAMQAQRWPPALQSRMSAAAWVCLARNA